MDEQGHNLERLIAAADLASQDERLMLADAMDGAGRADEARWLRSETVPVVRVPWVPADGPVRPARVDIEPAGGWFTYGGERRAIVRESSVSTARALQILDVSDADAEVMIGTDWYVVWDEDGHEYLILGGADEASARNDTARSWT